jgi:putative phosphoesterase
VEKTQPDMVILLGDLYYHGPRNPLPKDYDPMQVAQLLHKYLPILHIVRGNCDSEVDQTITQKEFLEHLQLNISGKDFVFSHGHRYNLATPPPIPFDVLVYGHEHVGYIKLCEEKIFANSGSLSLPKHGSENSFLEITSKEIVLKELSSQNILQRVGIDEN